MDTANFEFPFSNFVPFVARQTESAAFLPFFVKTIAFFLTSSLCWVYS